MAVETPPFVLQGSSHPATVFRHLTQALSGSPVGTFAGGAAATTAGGGHGIVGAGDLAVTQNGTPNMSVNVATGLALIRGTESASQGVYSFFNDATVNLAVAASDPTNPRWDLVIAQVRDSNYSGANLDARLTVVTGTAAASPADPSLTAFPDALVLARIVVAAASTSVVTAGITDLRTRAAALGAPIVCTSGRRPSGASLAAGLRIYETDTFREYVYNGTAFQSATAPIVCTSSTRPTSPLYAGLRIYETDTFREYVFNGAAWQSATATIAATSSTRPTSPLYNGLRIYETDTFREYVYNGTAWQSSTAPIVCTSSTRPTSPLFNGLRIYETDTFREYVYNGAAWQSATAIISCTSSARPTSPLYAGLQIYETDTGRSRYYDGSSWVWFAGPSPTVYLTRTTNQSIANGATDAITWPNEITDTDNWHVAAGAIITVGETGVFAITWNIQPSITAVGFSGTGILTAGSRTYTYTLAAASAPSSYWYGGSVIVPLAATNTVTLSYTNGTGAAVNMQGSIDLRLLGGK